MSFVQFVPAEPKGHVSARARPKIGIKKTPGQVKAPPRTNLQIESDKVKAALLSHNPVVYDGSDITIGGVTYSVVKRSADGSWSVTVDLISNDQKFILKVMRSKYATSSPNPVHRFAKEVSQQKLAYPYAPKIVHYGFVRAGMELPTVVDNMMLYILMEHKGDTLEHFLDTYPRKVDEVKQSTLETCRRIGLVREDMTLDNFVIDANERVYAIDFDPQLVQIGQVVNEEAVNDMFEIYEMEPMVATTVRASV